MSPNDLQAAENWYVGAAVGKTSLDYSATDLTSDLANLGWTINNPSVDDSDSAWKAYAGIEFNDWLAVEAAYVDLGKVVTRFGATIPPTQIDALLSDTHSVHPYQGDGWVVAGVARIAFVPDRFSIVGRAGLFRWESETTVQVISGGTGSVAGDDSGTDGMFGIGIEWQFNEQWSLTADWERYKLNEWLDVPSIGVRFSF
jgi:OOP family OmpA-OmpF porin